MRFYLSALGLFLGALFTSTPAHCRKLLSNSTSASISNYCFPSGDNNYCQGAGASGSSLASGSGSPSGSSESGSGSDSGDSCSLTTSSNSAQTGEIATNIKSINPDGIANTSCTIDTVDQSIWHSYRYICYLSNVNAKPIIFNGQSFFFGSFEYTVKKAKDFFGNWKTTYTLSKPFQLECSNLNWSPDSAEEIQKQKLIFESLQNAQCQGVALYPGERSFKVDYTNFGSNFPNLTLTGCRTW